MEGAFICASKKPNNPVLLHVSARSQVAQLTREMLKEMVYDVASAAVLIVPSVKWLSLFPSISTITFLWVKFSRKFLFMHFPFSKIWNFILAK